MDQTTPTNLRALRRMPVHFGLMPGPRQDADGVPFDWTDNPDRMVYSVSFRSEAAALRAILPPCFELDGEPVVTVELQQLRNLRWLAGRGYDTLGVKFPARYDGVDKARGPFLAVLWENLADPIVSGREELGYNKLYCETDPVRRIGGRHFISAGWQGHRFFEMEIEDLTPATSAAPSQPASAPAADTGTLSGTLHYKYVPATGAWGEADAEYPVLTPAQAGTRTLESWNGHGTVRFIESRWEDLPTLHHIVNRLAALPQLEMLGATVAKSVGGGDIYNQRRLR